MNTLPTLTLLTALLAASGLNWAQAQAPSQAQTQTPDTTVLKGEEVSTDRLIEVLTPPPKMRTLRVDREQDKPVAARRPSASLLITFHTASTELTPEARRQLDTLAEALKSDRLLTYQFELEGHADRRGSTQNNLSLSQGRADSVRDYLVKVHGIAAERLIPVGKGDSEPLNPGQANAPENRRVTIITRTPAP